jgi:hypothetical protein
MDIDRPCIEKQVLLEYETRLRLKSEKPEGNCFVRLWKIRGGVSSFSGVFLKSRLN